MGLKFQSVSVYEKYFFFIKLKIILLFIILFYIYIFYIILYYLFRTSRGWKHYVPRALVGMEGVIRQYNFDGCIAFEKHDFEQCFGVRITASYVLIHLVSICIRC